MDTKPFLRRQLEQLRRRLTRNSRPTNGKSLTLDELLASEHWRRERPAGPELKQALGFIHAELEQTRRLLALPPDPLSLRSSAIRDELRSLLRGDVECLSIDGAWELCGALKRINLYLGDASYVGTQLRYELHRPAGDRHGWTRLSPAAELRRLVRRYDNETVTGADHRRTVNLLNNLYLLRAEAGRNGRARAALKCHYLHCLAPLLLVLVAALGVSYGSTGASPGRLVVLTAAAGALGSTLSGVFRVRDHLARLDELRNFWPTMRVQPLTGACAGLFVLLALASKTIAIGSTSSPSGSLTPAGLALIAFAAGFSEPFFLGIIQRVAGGPDSAPEATPTSAAKKNPA